MSTERPPLLSVVIPTCNRRNVLPACLEALAGQTLPPDAFEVIVIDDGSSDDTPQILSAARHTLPYSLDIIRQENRGPAAARNAGIHQTTAPVILFLGDDIIASPDLLQQHQIWHEAHPDPREALLGFVTWDPLYPITPFMRWLENGGPQFNYSAIRGNRADYRFFYTCNLSVKRRFLLENGFFDEDFKHAAYEDIELAYRLEKNGMVLHFNRCASAWHRHPTTVESGKKRMRMVGQAAALVENKHPELRFINGFEKAVLNNPDRSGFWAIIHSIMSRFPAIPWVSQRIAWRAHEYYRRQLAAEAIEGYRTARSDYH